MLIYKQYYVCGILSDRIYQHLNRQEVIGDSQNGFVHSMAHKPDNFFLKTSVKALIRVE